MTNNIVTKYTPVTATGSIFAEELTTKYVQLSNYKYLDFVLVCSGGTVSEVLVSALAKRGEDGTETPIEFRQKNTDTAALTPIPMAGKTITIGDADALKTNLFAFRISAETLAEIGGDRAALRVSKADGSTVLGSILAVSYEPRYTE